MKIVILGAGRVASHLARAFVCAGHDIAVWNRSAANLESISEKIGCFCTTDMSQLPKDADVYLISVKDDAVLSVVDALSDVLNDTNALVAHTAGSMPLALIEDKFSNCGVFYPMQTFTKDKILEYKKIPFFIETSCKDNNLLKELAESVSEIVYELDSEKRQYLHLASVFACNFVNHCYAISENILKKIDVPFSVMYPLIDETTNKVKAIKPVDGQTGPAVRRDNVVMDKQMQLLIDDPKLQEIYRILSKNIIKYDDNCHD